MAAAEGPLRISIVSMSFGFRSAMRFTGASWLEALEPPEARVTAFAPDGIATLLTITPSITYSGSEAPLIEETPRRLSCTPPPGAPELAVMFAPAIFPCSALSTLSEGVRFSSSLVMVATAFARLRRATVVAWPVTTIPSRFRTSSPSRTLAVFSPAATVTVRLV